MCESLVLVQQEGQRIGYAPVSTSDQNLARQLGPALGKVNRLFVEKQSWARNELNGRGCCEGSYRLLWSQQKVSFLIVSVCLGLFRFPSVF